MYKIVICIFLAAIVLEVRDEKLNGDRYSEAVDLLNNVLYQLRRRNGPYLTLIGVEAAYYYIPQIDYSFDTLMLLPGGNVFIEMCTVEISLNLLEKKTTLIIITCNGQESARQVLNGTIEV
ncbi:hypothetical protein CVS40_5421 [Lucilia cuprina]|nr:hypothetical protein CVS40_5421 [Lucilia cuprina]